MTKIFDEEGTSRDFSFDYSFWSHDSFRTRDDGYCEPETDKYHDQKFVYNVVCVSKGNDSNTPFSIIISSN